MGKLLILALVGFSLFGTLYSASIQSSLHQSQERSSEFQYETLARNTALAGYIQARQRLADAFASDTFSGTFEGGVYEVEVVVNGDHAVVEATSTVEDYTGSPVSFTIDAEFERSGEASLLPVPTYFTYALLADQDITMGGNEGIAAFLHDGVGSENELNANVHTNGDLDVNGTGNRRVLGFGSYVGTGTGKLNQKFVPNYNPDNLPVTAPAAAVTIPAWDLSTFSENAVIDQVSTGNVTLSGTLNLGGTRGDPYIWLVKGGLDATGSTVINGYVVFLVEGSASLNSVVAGSGYSGNESSIAFYVKGQTSIQGNTEVWGQFYSLGDFTLGGNPTIYGSITAAGNLSVKGNPTILYRSASPALTTVWQEPSIRLVAYNER
jgi:hypothetical protein